MKTPQEIVKMQMDMIEKGVKNAFSEDMERERDLIDYEEDKLANNKY